MKLELYSTFWVIRGGVVIGELTGPGDKALAWAIQDYGAGVTVKHAASWPDLRVGGKV